MKITIAGAGIGGLTAALSLHKAGFEVDVFESSKEIRPLGVGINLLPHAVRVLTHLGLQDQLAKEAVATRELVYFNKFGQRIWQEDRGEFAGYKWPQFCVHRGLFQMQLLDAVKKAIGEDHIHAGHHLQHCENLPDGVETIFIDKENNECVRKETAGLLIAVDGIHSVVRKQFYPAEGPPKFSGILLHRGISKAKPFLTGCSMIMAGSAAKKFVAYPISPVLDEEGNQWINWIADLSVGVEALPLVRDWNRKADKRKLLSAFHEWHFEWLDILSLIRNAEAIYEFPMSDRDPLPQWSFGHISLLGDAAHPMYPIGSNGASQAILDAECLAESLLENENPVDALKQYEAKRLPATAKIVLLNRQMGPEQVMQIVDDRAPDGFSNLYDIISRDELEAIANQYKKIAGFEKETLNQKL